MRNVRLPSFRVTAQGIQPLQPMTRLTRQRAISASFPLACGRRTGSSHTLPGRRASSGFPSYFRLWRRWLRLLTPVTYFCMLLGMRALTALPHPELFWKTMIFVLFVATRVLAFLAHPQSHTFVCSWGLAASPPARNPKPFENRVLFLSQAMAALVALAIPRTHLKNADAVLLFYCRNAQNPKRASEAASGCVSK